MTQLVGRLPAIYHLQSLGDGPVSITDRMQRHSRYVVAWRLSNTLEADFCVAALPEALARGKPEVFNTD